LITSFYSLVIDRALRQLRRSLPEFSGMKHGDKVLDVCSGTGDQATKLAKLGIEAYGIDLDPKMIKIAEGKIKKYGKGNLHFQLADATALPFGDNFFDFATISLALHEKPPEVQQRVIAEMRRVVKKGGSLVLADYSVPAKRLYRFAEMLVGGEHYGCFKIYQASRGLENLANTLKLDVERRLDVMGGSLQLFKIRN
jgi:ubiquinone/menaquinone biosynthesis C-methylase UbiE